MGPLNWIMGNQPNHSSTEALQYQVFGVKLFEIANEPINIIFF